MPSWVRDESKWEKAKDIVKKEYKLTEEDGEEFWKLVTGVYKRMGGEIKKANEGLNSIIEMLATRRVGSDDVKKELDRREELGKEATHTSSIETFVNSRSVTNIRKTLKGLNQLFKK